MFLCPAFYGSEKLENGPNTPLPCNHSFVTIPSVATRSGQNTRPGEGTPHLGNLVPACCQIPSKDEKQHLKGGNGKKRDEMEKGRKKFAAIFAGLSLISMLLASPISKPNSSSLTQLQQVRAISDMHPSRYVYICTNFENKEMDHMSTLPQMLDATSNSLTCRAL